MAVYVLVEVIRWDIVIEVGTSRDYSAPSPASTRSHPALKVILQNDRMTRLVAGERRISLALSVIVRGVSGLVVCRSLSPGLSQEEPQKGHHDKLLNPERLLEQGRDSGKTKQIYSVYSRSFL